ncbi:MAG TPA: His/Gly/Thr/Pro-type tRNA ligase C-terminal domain-containing protein, partial [Bacteroidales bacterium]|nr:His/Gly/Thr/Pro-type tRNA ligase C-terminal domain-containing protein [Bacteroidales bacterium]
SEKFVNYAKKVLNLLSNFNLKGIIDDRNEKMGRKIRDAEIKKIPYMIIVGEKEEKNNVISVRKHGVGDMGEFGIDNFVKMVEEEINNIIN